MNKVNGINNARIYNSTDSYIVYSERNGQLCLGNGFIDMNIIMRFDIDVSCCCIASDGSFLVTASQAVVSIYSLTERNQDVVAENLGKPNFMCLDNSNTLLSICVAKMVYIFNIPTRTTTILEGHDGIITATKFIGPQIISISEDRTFTIWNIQNNSFTFKSSIVSSSPFTTIDIDPREERMSFCVGAEDGTLRFYRLIYDQTTNLISHTKLMNTFNNCPPFDTPTKASEEKSEKVISSTPLWRLNNYKNEKTVEESIRVESTDAIIALKYRQLGGSALIYVGCCQSISIINADNFESMYRFDFNQVALAESPQSTMSIADSIFFSFDHLDEYVLVGSSLNESIDVFRITGVELPVSVSDEVFLPEKGELLGDYIARMISTRFRGAWATEVIKMCLISLSVVDIFEISQLYSPHSKEKLKSLTADMIPPFILSSLMACSHEGRELSLCFSFTNMEIDKSSPLKFVNHSSAADRSSKKIPKPLPSPIKKGDKPTTFRSKVRSSGYTSSPVVTKMFSKPSTLKTKNNSKFSITDRLKSNPPSKINEQYLNIKHQEPVLCVAFQPKGGFFMAGSVDKSISLHRHLNNKISSKNFMGHSSPINDISIGQIYSPGFGNMVLSFSKGDGYANLWASEISDPLLKFESSKENGPLKGVKFFCRDQLVIASRTNTIQVCSYTVKKPDPACIQPVLNSLYNSTKVLASYNFPSNQVSAFSCINSTHSSSVLVGLSDKTLNLLDVNFGKVISKSEPMKRAVNAFGIADYYTLVHASDNHNPPPQEIGISTMGSGYTLANVFATSSLVDSIKLWDVRAFSKPVLQLFGHINKRVVLGVALSPCGRFIVSGSEDNQAYIYDIRKAAVLHTLKGGHKEVVSSVAFNPVKSEILTGGIDGKLNLWK